MVLGVLPEKGVQVNGKARETNSPPTELPTLFGYESG